MDNKSRSSPKTVRMLWGIAAAAAIVALAIYCWNSVRMGRFDWGHFLNPLGILTLAVANLIDSGRGLVYRILLAFALGLIIVGFILIVFS